jgi:hypothetical protein
LPLFNQKTSVSTTTIFLYLVTLLTKAGIYTREADLRCKPARVYKQSNEAAIMTDLVTLAGLTGHGPEPQA